MPSAAACATQSTLLARTELCDKWEAHPKTASSKIHDPGGQPTGFEDPCNYPVTLPIGKQRSNLLMKLLLFSCYKWPFSILKAAKHCSCSGRCICQVGQILEQLSYLKSGIYPFQQVFHVAILPNSLKTP